MKDNFEGGIVMLTKSDYLVLFHCCLIAMMIGLSFGFGFKVSPSVGWFVFAGNAFLFYPIVMIADLLIDIYSKRS